LGRISYVYDANAHTPVSPWGIFIILVPVVGGLIVTFLVTKFAPEARGHGVPDVCPASSEQYGAVTLPKGALRY
jgi:chloride channel protein, CIC family